jgi:glycosyltransferase involved in cell wall biosynthesis
MRILVANKFWYMRGGLERVMFDEIALLEEAGHEVAHFSTQHPCNDASPWSGDFVSYLELGESEALTVGDKLKAVERLFYNREAAANFDRVVDRFQPDVVHCHGIHRQISPAILGVARRRRIPVVQTLHDYHHVCPADVLLRGGRVRCEPRRCRRLWYGAAVSNSCVRSSLAKSALSAAETSFQRFTGAYERGVSCFICPSEFMRDTMQRGGWKVPMRLIRNSVPLDESPRPGTPGEYVLFAGRLSSEKGLDVLLDAAQQAGVRVLVAGEGPEEQRARAIGGAEFLGRVSTERVRELLHGSRAAVVPSIAFENASLSVLEPMAAGVPVIASAVGGIPELVRAGQEGLLVAPGNVEMLRDALARISSDRALAARLGAAGRARAQTEFSPDRHLKELERLYADVTTKGVQP